ncbi:hypothetical protein JX580_05195 [Thiomicrospira microaerophila]|uniref:hypothetical protein n=1 Tax=Thiomicrospira microaerophila TaxID=406020 RepID=UPI00200CD3C1|nr:hypothetical protein [Thiomicrospira microaerophila]UQB43273.1 hypothetical protein JX580_05195 [Thiomicrospira microaerophila]
MILEHLKTLKDKISNKNKKFKLPNIEPIIDQYDVIVHIGAPKTGSSAIQKYLLENQKTLLKLGYYYPNHGLDQNGISGGHSIIGKQIIDNQITEAETTFQNFITEAKKNKSILLISAESLFNRPIELKQILKDHRCKIVSFFRDPLESIYSNYNQGIKRHYATARLVPFCNGLLERPADFFSGEVFTKWVQCFGKEHITILGYDLELFEKKPIQSVFLYGIGIDELTQKEYFTFNNAQINQSYCLAALELKRMFNFILDPQNNKLNFEIDWFLQETSDQNAKERFNLKDRIDSALFNQLKEKFADSNQRIKSDYLTEINPNFLTVQKENKKQVIDQRKLHNQVLAIMKRLKKNKPMLYDYVHTCLKATLNQNNNSYEVLKLAEMFNYDINQFTSIDTWFSDQQLEKMPKYMMADFYRDIAQICFTRGDIKHAERLITKAIEHRPTGPGIINLSHKINNSKKID